MKKEEVGVERRRRNQKRGIRSSQSKGQIESVKTESWRREGG